jgi:hypothetical protein
MIPSREWRRLAFLPLTLVLAGCGDGAPPVDTSTNEVGVSGVVSVRGHPATGGEIRFNPSNSQRIAPTKSAPIGPDGSYSIKTYTGLNEVSFTGEVATKNSGVGLVKESVDVKSGDNKIDFDVLGKGAQLPYSLPVEKKKRG